MDDIPEGQFSGESVAMVDDWLPLLKTAAEVPSCRIMKCFEGENFVDFVGLSVWHLKTDKLHNLLNAKTTIL